MVETRLDLEPEVQEIFKHIDNGNNFLLSGGAGSGKTYSLIRVIKQVIAENPTANIACMTYTNAAVREISDRFNSKNLSVSTIHDFLWDNIKSFQKELKNSLIYLINNDEEKKIKAANGDVPESYFNEIEKIQYKEYLAIQKGIISHDELLILANYMFQTYPKLCDILKDKFQFILIDEYQDTNKLVVEIFLDYLKQSKRKNIVGFFGDAMQSIYDDGVGNINNYVSLGNVKEVKKEQNRRNPRLVYELANRLRTDGIIQTHSNDSSAPNMEDEKVKDGDIKFYYSQDKEKLEYLKEKISWDFDNPKETKILNLTHNLIAPKAGFEKLMAIYDRDPIIKLKNDILAKIKKKPDEVNISDNDTFDDVVDKAQLKNRQKQLKKDIIISEYSSLYNQLKDLPFSEVRKIYVSKDNLIDDKKDDEDDEAKPSSKRDNLIKHLFKIQDCINLYQEKKYNEFLRKTEFPIREAKDKKRLKEIIETLTSKSKEMNIEEAIKYADEEGIYKKDDKLKKFIDKNKYIYDQVKQIDFKEFQNLFEYLEGYTPFSTQHKIKGAEFNDVLIIMDNGRWNDYNFEYLFKNSGKESVLERTQKLFYVCCTRSKENLVVYYHKPTKNTLNTAKCWFGGDNVILI